MLTLTEKIEWLERAEIESALDRAGWVKARAARMLGITERMIGYKIRKYGIRREVMSSQGFGAQGSSVSAQERSFRQEKNSEEER